MRRARRSPFRVTMALLSGFLGWGALTCNTATRIQAAEYDPTTIVAQVVGGTNSGVGFEYLPAGTVMVTVKLEPRDSNARFNGKSTVHNPSGTILWTLKEQEDRLHEWEGDGLDPDHNPDGELTILNSGPSARFEGKLAHLPSGDYHGIPDFKVSVADLDIDIDSLGLHWTDATREPHWPPCGLLHEDENEDVEEGGLYLPPTLWTPGEQGPWPTSQEVASTDYKVLKVTLRTKWTGHPDPDRPVPNPVGHLCFHAVGTPIGGGVDYVALYRKSTLEKIEFGTTEIPVSAEGFNGEEFWLLTNGTWPTDPTAGYRLPVTLVATFTWVTSLKVGDEPPGSTAFTATDFVRLAPFRVDFADSLIKTGFTKSNEGVLVDPPTVVTEVAATVYPTAWTQSAQIVVKDEPEERFKIVAPAQGPTFDRDLENGVVRFRITGVSATPANPTVDSHLQATYNGQLVSQHPVRVVVPTSVTYPADSTAHADKDNVALGWETDPVFVGDPLFPVGEGQVGLITVWPRLTQLTVQDQFGDNLLKEYQGTDVWAYFGVNAGWMRIQCTLDNSAVFRPIICSFWWKENFPIVVDDEDPAIAAWTNPSTPRHNAPVPTSEQTYEMRVGGHGIGGVSVRTTVDANDNMKLDFPPFE